MPLPSDSASRPGPKTASLFDYSGKGRVARLPKAVRDQINIGMRDDVPYPKIIDGLGEHGKGLKPAHLSQSKNGSSGTISAGTP